MIDENFFQPEFYRFNEDSTELAKLVLRDTSQKTICNYLDAACGCGVIGIEILRNKEIENSVFVEKQSEFLESLKKNIDKYIPGKKALIEINDLRNLSAEIKFDLITINPPYFNSKNSRPSPDENKNICRIFEDHQLVEIFEKLLYFLEDDGSLYFSFRKEEISLIDSIVIRNRRRLNMCQEINGASLFRIM